ncbi:MAG: hypothetical protein LBS69_11810 [Prevotellaceae bacterium]|jgi:hypothetical protein|nr:hypothetical protein [Prevotellaceae bacterium]
MRKLRHQIDEIMEEVHHEIKVDLALEAPTPEKEEATGQSSDLEDEEGESEETESYNTLEEILKNM